MEGSRSCQDMVDERTGQTNLWRESQGDSVKFRVTIVPEGEVLD